MMSTLLRPVALALGVALLVAGGSARAQFVGGYGGGYGYGAYDGGGYHSSTLEEGAAHGVADVVRSAGMKNLLDSQAATQLEEARRRNLLNRSLYVDTYFHNKAQNLAYHKEHVWNHPDQEQIRRINEARKPARLEGGQLDPVTGEINWPIALRMDRFAPYRAELERLFGRWANEGADAGADTYFTIRKSVDSFRAILKRNVNDIPSQEYAESARFLESLAYEARFAASP